MCNHLGLALARQGDQRVGERSSCRCCDTTNLLIFWERKESGGRVGHNVGRTMLVLQTQLSNRICSLCVVVSVGPLSGFLGHDDLLASPAQVAVVVLPYLVPGGCVGLIEAWLCLALCI
jgi:hypothetical protein